MGNVQVQTTAAQLDQGLKILANRYLDVSGRPPETQKDSKLLAPAPIDLLTNLYLPKEVAQFLEQPLKMLNLELEPTETIHKIAKKIIRHYTIRTPVGKMVLIYLDPKVIQDPSPSYWGQFNYFGSLFAKEYKSVFVFSDAENAELAYKEVLQQWRDIFNFEKVELLLKDMIRVLQTSERKVVVSEIRERFGLPAKTEVEIPAEKVRLINTKKLYELLCKYFTDNDDLIQLCFQLQEYDLNYENLEGDTIKTKFISLISHFEKRAILPVLVDYCKEARKEISWDEVEHEPE